MFFMQMSGHMCVGSRLVYMCLNYSDGFEASFSSLQIKIRESKIRNTDINGILEELEGAGPLFVLNKYQKDIFTYPHTVI